MSTPFQFDFSGEFPTLQNDLAPNEIIDDFFSPQDFAEISPEQIAMPAFAEPVWRAMALAPPAPIHFSGPNEVGDFMGPPKLRKESSATFQERSTKTIPINVSKNSSKSSSKRPALVPAEQPFMLMPTHFFTNNSLDDIWFNINRILNDTNGISFEFVEGSCEWNGYYLHGATHCKFQVHIYNGPSGYIVECNRLAGDSQPFRTIYSQLKSRMSSSCDNIREFDSFTACTPVPSPLCLGDEEALLGLAPILRMVKENTVDAQLEGCRMLCDLTLDESMHAHLCESGCILALRDLITNSPWEWVQHHAASALANLSDSKVCQDAIIEAGVLPVLLQLATDGTYQSAEMRRLAVLVLANLCSRVASRVVTSLGHAEVSTWMSTVPDLKDERLKLHAIRARDHLSLVLAV